LPSSKIKELYSIPLSFDALTHGFKYGKQFVPMGDAEMHAVKVEGAKSISLIGFEKKEKIPRHYFVVT
jgi:non-homologous end joining protein Ku